MVVVGDAPFVSDSILDARTKARHPSHVRVVTFDSMVLVVQSIVPSICSSDDFQQNVLSTMVLTNGKCVILSLQVSLQRRSTEYTHRTLLTLFQTFFVRSASPDHASSCPGLVLWPRHLASAAVRRHPTLDKQPPKPLTRNPGWLPISHYPRLVRRVLLQCTGSPAAIVAVSRWRASAADGDAGRVEDGWGSRGRTSRGEHCFGCCCCC